MISEKAVVENTQDVDLGDATPCCFFGNASY
jgi:hypothetical protein